MKKVLCIALLTMAANYTYGQKNITNQNLIWYGLFTTFEINKETLKPTIEGINKFTVKIDAVYGSNSLNIKGVNEGIVVSNVKLVRYGSDENIV